MAIQLYISNSLQALASRYCHVSNTRESAVFLKDTIITQTDGMNRWLSLEIAREKGIFSHFNFPKPNEFIHHIQKLIRLSTRKSLDKHQLKWIIYDLLNSDEFKTLYGEIAAYYKEASQKRIQLSMQLADLFDQYVIYRTDFIELWNRNDQILSHKDKTPLQHADWQGWIWRKIKSASPDMPLDRVEVRTLLLKELDNPDTQRIIRQHHPSIALFGLSVLTEFHITILRKLGEFISLDCYFLNPSPETYWYDNKTKRAIHYWIKRMGLTEEELHLNRGNTLLANNARLGQDTFLMLLEHEEFINALDDRDAVPPHRDTLLSKIQHDIYHNAKDAERNNITKEDLTDFSIQITSSYTPLREVETLYNYLLRCLEKDPDLQPKDFLILTTDIDLYAPYIRAVFDNSHVTLPYSIADQSHAGFDNLPGIINALLQLSEDYFTPKDILQFLDIPIISDQFEITNSPELRQMIRDAYIRIGIEGSEDDESYVVSWQSGFEKIILGYALAGSPEYTLPNGKTTYPLDTMEGTDLYMGFRLKVFVDHLIEMIRSRSQNRTLKEWKQFIDEEIIETFILMNDDHAEELKYIEFQLDQLLGAHRWMDKKISFQVFKEAFTNALFDETRKGRFIDGRITFCSMIPMRSIPFEVVGMLGMNRDKFPRKNQKLGFNLMENEYRSGDRNNRYSDRYLFLEFLISTKKYLYLSYIGQQVINNKSLPPSILIDEILEYIRSGMQDVSDWHNMTIPHPLYSFSHQYYEMSSTTDNGLYTYFDYSASGNPCMTQHAANHEQGEKSSVLAIELKDLIKFWQHPIKWYYQNKLHIYYEEYDEEDIPDHETFHLDNLAHYQLRNELLEDMDEMSLDRLKKQGKLSLGSMGEIQLKEINESIKDIKLKFDELTADLTMTQLDISLSIHPYKITGSIQSIFDDKFILLGVSRSDSIYKTVWALWLQHLVLIASGRGKNSHLLSPKKPDGIVLDFGKINVETAKEHLRIILDEYVKGQERILPFLPNFMTKPAIKNQIKYLKKKSEPSSNHNYMDAYINMHARSGGLNPLLKNEQIFEELNEYILQPFLNIYGAEIKQLKDKK